jgi:hypothetical protein
VENKEQFLARKNEAYELRLRGRSYRQIAAELGVSVGTAHRWVIEVCDLVVLPNVQEVRKQEVDRLMRYLDRLDERIEDGDDKAIGLAIKVSERLTKMLGVDMPTVSVTEHSVVSEMDLDIRKLIEEQGKLNSVAKELAARKGVADSIVEGEVDA